MSIHPTFKRYRYDQQASAVIDTLRGDDTAQGFVCGCNPAYSELIIEALNTLDIARTYDHQLSGTNVVTINNHSSRARKDLSMGLRMVANMLNTDMLFYGRGGMIITPTRTAFEIRADLTLTTNPPPTGE